MKLLKRVGLVGLILVALVGAGLWIAAYLVTARYQPADTPEGVAYNYHLAIIRKDYAHAYTYLSPTLPHYPANANEFRSDLQRSEGGSSQIRRCVYIETIQNSEAVTRVILFEQWYTFLCTPTRPSVPENLSYNSLRVDLQREDQVWKIIDSSSHFAKCWASVEEDCP